MTQDLTLNPDRFFSPDPARRTLARALYQSVKDLPIISPHGHTDPAWFADNANFSNATDLLLVPDHYVLRMLYSQGIPLDALAVARKDGGPAADPREAWRRFAEHYYLFRGTPSRIWLDHVFGEVFGLEVRLSTDTADLYYDTITEALQTDAYKPRAILDRFNVAFLATTEGALDPLTHHAKIMADGWGERVVTTFRPDDVIDASRPDFAGNIARLGEITGEDTTSWRGYLAALRDRRAFFKAHGATASDHGHPTPLTANLSDSEAADLFEACLSGKADDARQELFRAQMLTEMARMSLEDGLVMQLHPGSVRNHNRTLHEAFGTDKGADIPQRVSYVDSLKPLLDVVGNDPRFQLILFTLDESNYARELAPLAGHYPCLRLGPPWWFHDSPEGMLRFRRQVTETAGFYNTAGFNDDTRALLSIPARHDLARRMDARFLSDLVMEHRLAEDEAFDLMTELAVKLVRKAYKLPMD
ncbi:MAG: glucuronate isomerase [Henriciella sp.]|uniref:glucuronate isomerase n=1 Tax=Henriciella sp. TaxID=1968823 RepID=UPI003C70648B